MATLISNSKFAKNVFEFIGLILLVGHSLGCNSGSVTMNSMGLTAEGLAITYPTQGLKKMRTLAPRLAITGECAAEFNGLEISFDGVAFTDFKNFATGVTTTADPSVNLIDYKINCSEQGTFEFTINDLLQMLTRYSMSFSATEPLQSDITVWFRAYNDRSTSIVKTVTLTRMSDLLTGLTLVSPTTSPGMDSTPTMEASEDLEIGDSVTLYSNTTCDSLAGGPAIYTGIPLQFDTFILTEFTDYEFYAKINGGSCSVKLLNYKYDSTATSPTLSGSINSQNKITLSWSDVTNVTSYTIRRRDSGEWNDIVSSTTLTHYSDTSVVAGITYDYKVIAQIEGGATRSSNILTKKALGGFQSAPSTTVVKKDITVQWGPVTGASGYKVIWSLTPGNVSASSTVEDPSSTEYIIPGGNLFDRRTYYISVKAKNGSDYVISEEVQATTEYIEEPDLTFGSNGQLIVTGESPTARQAVTAIDFDINGNIYYVGRINSGTNGLDGIYGKQRPNNEYGSFEVLSNSSQNESFTSLATFRDSGESIVGGWANTNNVLWKFLNDGTLKIDFWKLFQAEQVSAFNGVNYSLTGATATATVDYSADSRKSKIIRTLFDKNNSKIYACESAVDSNSEDFLSGATHVYRYELNGTADSTWGTYGDATVSLPNVTLIAVDCSLDNNGSVVILGKSQLTNTSTSRMTIIKLSQDGALSSAFNQSGYLFWDQTIATNWEEQPRRMVILPDNDIIAIGSIYSTANTDYHRPILVKFKSDGSSLDTTFGGSGNGSWHSEDTASFASGAIDPKDSKFLYLTGWKDNGSYLKDMAIWKFNLNSGSLELGFGTSGVWLSNGASGNDEGFDIGINPKNFYIYVGGRMDYPQFGGGTTYNGMVWSFK